MHTRRWAAALLLGAACFGTRPVAQTPSLAPPPDVIGLRLGMTEGEVIATLRARDRGVRLRTVAQTLPNRDATRATVTIYAGFYGDDRAGVGDEIVKVEFTNPTPVPRVLGIWRKQLFLQGHELSTANTTAAIREKYGTPRFTQTATGLTHWTWATGFAGKPPPSLSACIGGAHPIDGLAINIVTDSLVEPRAYFLAPDCGIAINAVVHDARGLVTAVGTSLVDYPAGVRAREEIEELGRRPDMRPVEADRRGKPTL